MWQLLWVEWVHLITSLDNYNNTNFVNRKPGNSSLLHHNLPHALLVPPHHNLPPRFPLFPPLVCSTPLPSPSSPSLPQGRVQPQKEEGGEKSYIHLETACSILLLGFNLWLCLAIDSGAVLLFMWDPFKSGVNFRRPWLSSSFESTGDGCRQAAVSTIWPPPPFPPQSPPGGQKKLYIRIFLFYKL